MTTDYKSGYFADFVPKGYRTISKSEKVKVGDYYWSRKSYFPVNSVMVGHKNKLPVIRKHESAQTNNSFLQFGECQS